MRLLPNLKIKEVVSVGGGRPGWLTFLIFGLLLAGLGMGGCANFNPRLEARLNFFDWDIPAGYPAPRVPADNPQTAAKVALGRHLFYDKRLSVNESLSCAGCHFQEFAFSDRRPTGIGATGQSHSRNSMSLTNVAYYANFNWANHSVPGLEHQAMTPLFGEDPVELGMGGLEAEIPKRLGADERYSDLFQAAFPEDEQKITVGNITKALAAFQRVLISFDSPYDRFQRGDDSAIPPAAKQGLDLFLGEKMECFHCHSGFNFSDNVDFEGSVGKSEAFFNTGLYNIDGSGGDPTNPGLFEITFRTDDLGKFKPLSLRNIAVSFPYMHDGSIACDEALADDWAACRDNALGKVVDHYAAGGRNWAAKDGSLRDPDNQLTSGFVPGFDLSPGEKEAMIAFLNSLTDCDFLTREDFSNPWPPDHQNHEAPPELPAGHPCRARPAGGPQ